MAPSRLHDEPAPSGRVASTRRLPRVFGATAAAVVMVLGATLAASAQGPSASPPMPSASPLASGMPLGVRPEGTWTVTAYDAWSEGLVEPLRGSTLTVALLPAGRLEGETGCGTYLGGYSVDGDGIRLGVISKGAERCGARRTDEAFSFTQALALVTRWSPSAAGLDLLDDEGRVRVTLAQGAGNGLVGDWAVVRFGTGELRSALEGTEVGIVFSQDGRVTGSTGCRLFEGAYSTEADRVLIAPIGPEGLPCEGEEQRQDRRVRAVLDTVVTWQREDGRLTLRDGDGGVSVEATLRSNAGPPAEASAAPSADPLPLPSAGSSAQPAG